MDLGLAGRTALITGGSKGIGLATARRLAMEGCHLHLAARTAADLERAKSALEGEYRVEVSIHTVDLSRGDEARGLVETCRDMDILVNCAGAIPGGSIDMIDEEHWREAWDLKVFGFINTCRAAYGIMTERGHGVIVNVIGVAGERNPPDYIAGAAGNASLMALTRGLGYTSLRHGVRVVGVNPGLTATDRLIFLLRTKAETQLGDRDRWRETLDPDYPPGEPEHIGDMVVFLASDLSGNTSGTIITIDGGSSGR